MKKKPILAGFILLITLISCQSSQKAVPKLEPVKSEVPEERLLFGENFLSQRNQNNIVYVSRKEYYKKLHSKPIGLYRGYGEATGNENDVYARRMADQRALLDIASQIRINISNTSVLHKSENESFYRQDITTSTFATLKNARPTRWYDRTNKVFYTIMEISRNSVNNQLRELANRTQKESRYFFKKALTEETYGNLTMAFLHYLSAYYISSQSLDKSIEYYDNSARRTYDVKIESKVKIQNLLNQIQVRLEAASKKGYTNTISIYTTFESEKVTPCKHLPLLCKVTQNSFQKNISVDTDRFGQADILLTEKLAPVLPVEIEIAINFQRLIKKISQDFYGFPDPLFAINFTSVIKKDQIYPAPIYIDVLYYIRGSAGIPHFQIDPIQQQNIHLVFKEQTWLQEDIDQIMQTGNINKFSTGKNPLVIIGHVELKSKNWGTNYLLGGIFSGLYLNTRKEEVIKNLHISVKAYGTTQRAALRDLSKQLSQEILKSLTRPY